MTQCKTGNLQKDMSEIPLKLINKKSPEKNSSLENILVVDDDQTVRDYLQDLFSSNGYSVRTASTGKEALRILDSEYFPLVLLDLRLPDLPGTEILNYVRHQGIVTAVLIITGYVSIDSVIEVLRQGAYDYITKPFNPQILLHRVAGALEKIRMDSITRDISSKIVYATEEERRSISRDIHDVVGQSLAVIKLTLRAISKKVPDTEGEILSDIEGLAAHVEDTMKEISRITKNLSPSYVTEVGFPKALRLYIETFAKKTGTQVHLSLPERFSLQDTQQDIHLFRIAQEALTNVVRHSGATRVDIHINITDGFIHFSIEDNGKGFYESQEQEMLGLGLIGMKERAAILGGKLSIESKPGRTTTLKIEVPYEYTDPA